MARLSVVPFRSRQRLHDFDESYLRRLAEGEPETEAHFVAYFGPLIRIKLRRRLRHHQWIDDICQETFLRVLRAVRAPEGGVRHAERLGAYVNAVCTNVMLEHLRAGTRHPQIADGLPEAPDRAQSAEARLLSAERRTRVQRVIEALPDKDRRVLRALFVEERDKDELCAELGVDRGYLRVLLHRAKHQFRAQYDGGARGGMDGGGAARGNVRQFPRPGRGL